MRQLVLDNLSKIESKPHILFEKTLVFFIAVVKMAGPKQENIEFIKKVIEIIIFVITKLSKDKDDTWAKISMSTLEKLA